MPDLDERRAVVSNADPKRDEPDIVTKLSTRSVRDTVSRLTEILHSKNLKVFAVIDQSSEARQVGLSLRDTTLVIFGSPAAGTPVMTASPLSALDLPLKVVIWSDDGQTKVSYYTPDALGTRHQLTPDLVGHLAAINVVTDALVAP